LQLDPRRRLVGCRRPGSLDQRKGARRPRRPHERKEETARRRITEEAGRQMFVRFGVAPIAWTNSDLPQLGGDTSLETCLKESRAAGYSGTETGVKFPMDPKILGPVLAAHRLALVSGWFSGELLSGSLAREKERMAAQLATFRALGAPVLIYAETTGSVQA